MQTDRSLGDHLGMFGIKLGNRHDCCLKIHNGIFADIGEGSIASHPGSACSGVNGEHALTGIEENWQGRPEILKVEKAPVFTWSAMV